MFELTGYILKNSTIASIGDIITMIPSARVPTPFFSIIVEIYDEKTTGTTAADTSSSKNIIYGDNLFVVNDIVPAPPGKCSIEINFDEHNFKRFAQMEHRVGMFGPFPENLWHIYTKID